MRILLIDNYDSFTYNLVQYLRECNAVPHIVKNDEISWPPNPNYDAIVLSPGPGLPKYSGDLMKLIDHFHDTTPILGVCLGHQAICQYFGGSLTVLPTVCHGIASELINVDYEDVLFKNLNEPIIVGRYHSWELSQDDFPDILIPTSYAKEKSIMSFRHKSLPIYGVQFHPESILSNQGKKIIQNFLSIVN